MYTANHTTIQMAKDLRQRDVQAAQDYRLRRDAQAERKSHTSGIGAAASAVVARTAHFLHVTRAHAHHA